MNASSEDFQICARFSVSLVSTIIKTKNDRVKMTNAAGRDR